VEKKFLHKIAKGIKQASKNSLTRSQHIPNAKVKGELQLAGASTASAIPIVDGINSPSPTKKRRRLDKAAKIARNKRSRDNRRRKKQVAAKAKMNQLTKETKDIEAQAATLEEEKKSIAVTMAKAKNVFDEATKLPPPPSQRIPAASDDKCKGKETGGKATNPKKSAARTAETRKTDREREDREKQPIQDSPKRKRHSSKTIRTPSRSSI